MQSFDVEPLKAAIHFVTRSYATEPERLGSIRLHKILWFTEIMALRQLGQRIFGETFSKAPYGPMASHLDEVVTALKSSGHLFVRTSDGDFDADVYIGKGNPEGRPLSDDQWRILKSVMRRIVDDHSATSISERTHDVLWESCSLGEIMPVEAAAVQFVPLSDADVEWAERSIADTSG